MLFSDLTNEFFNYFNLGSCSQTACSLDQKNLPRVIKHRDETKDVAMYYFMSHVDQEKWLVEGKRRT